MDDSVKRLIKSRKGLYTIQKVCKVSIKIVSSSTFVWITDTMVYVFSHNIVWWIKLAIHPHMWYCIQYTHAYTYSVPVVRFLKLRHVSSAPSPPPQPWWPQHILCHCHRPWAVKSHCGNRHRPVGEPVKSIACLELSSLWEESHEYRMTATKDTLINSV